MLSFEVKKNQRTQKKTSRCEGKNQRQTQPKYKIMPDPGIRTGDIGGR